MKISAQTGITLKSLLRLSFIHFLYWDKKKIKKKITLQSQFVFWQLAVSYFVWDLTKGSFCTTVLLHIYLSALLQAQ